MNIRQALSSDKRFLSPRRGSNPLPSDDRWDVLTIELPLLRWWAEALGRHMCDLSGIHDMLIMLLMHNNLINISWLPLRLHICRTCPLTFFPEQVQDSMSTRRTLRNLPHETQRTSLKLRMQSPTDLSNCVPCCSYVKSRSVFVTMTNLHRDLKFCLAKVLVVFHLAE